MATNQPEPENDQVTSRIRAIVCPQVDNSCKCDFCALGRRVKALRDKQPDPADQALVDEMYSRLECAVVDAAYWQAKYDGTWPSSEADITPHEARHRLLRGIIGDAAP